MEKWILLITFGNLAHAVDVYDTEKRCLEEASAMSKVLIRTSRGYSTHIGHCAPYREFILYYDRKKVYTLR